MARLSVIWVRLFQEHDRDALRRVYYESRRHAFHWLRRTLFQLEDFDNDTEGERVWVAVKDNAPVGFAGIWEADNFLHHLYVAPEHLRQGIGSLLLSTCMNSWRRPVTLKCMKSNRDAIRFYRKHGWFIESEGVSAVYGEYYLMKLDT